MNHNRKLFILGMLVTGLALTMPKAAIAEWIDIWSGTAKRAVKMPVRVPEPQISITGLNQSGYTTTELDKIVRYRISVSIPGFFINSVSLNNEKYTAVYIPGTVGLHSDGKPAIPVQPITVSLPSGTKPDVKVVNKAEVPVDSINVPPSQPSMPLMAGAEPTFTKDTATYGSDELFPDSTGFSAKVIKIRNHRFLFLYVAALRVMPASKRAIAISSLGLEVDLLPDTSKESQVDEGLADPNFDRMMFGENLSTRCRDRDSERCEDRDSGRCDNRHPRWFNEQHRKNTPGSPMTK